MRFTLCAIGSRGDVAPFLALGRALMGRGHEVVVVASPDFSEEATDAGLDFIPIGLSVAAFLDGAGTAMGSPLRSMAHMSGAFKMDPRDDFERLLVAAKGSQALVATGFTYGAPHVAEALGIAYRNVEFCPRHYPSAHHPPVFDPAPDRPRYLNKVLWRAYERSVEPRLWKTLGPWRQEHGLPPATGIYQRMLGLPGERFLAADKELASLPTDVEGTRQVSTILVPRTGALPDDVDRFLAAGDRPVYVGFGSMPATDVSGLLDVVLESAASLGVRAIVPASWVAAGERILPEDCLAVGHVCHGLLFPRIAAVVHHGGAGTTAEAARAGVPQIVVPHLADQYFWGHRVHQLGIGPMPLRYRQFSPRTLVPALREALNSPAIVRKAATLYDRRDSRDGAAELASLLCEDLAALPAGRTDPTTRV